MTVTGDEARGALMLFLRQSGIRDLGVLRAIETVPREAFLPHRLRDLGPRNISVPIACGQTMPPPLALASMFEALDAQSHERVLEIGTGSGYATAVLSRLAREVVSYERFRTLATEASRRLDQLGLRAKIVFGDGMAFPAEFGKYEKILVHAAIPSVPRSLGEALAENGRIVAGIPEDTAGSGASLAVFERGKDGDFVGRRLGPMRFQPPLAGVARAL